MSEWLSLKPTSDRKTRFYESQKNTFGLLPGIEGTCPCATTAEGGCWHIAKGRKLPECYVAKLISAYGGVRGILEHNTGALLGANDTQMVNLLDNEFTRFRDAELKRKAKGQPYSLQYRIHWSGDIFSERYAWALASVMRSKSDIEFWCYTRSFFAVPYLCDIPNLNLYLSLDPVNVQRGLSVFNEYKDKKNNLQICYMNKTNNFQDHIERATQILDEENRLRTVMGQVMKNNWALKQKLSICPVDTGKLTLEGGCATCKQCIKKAPNPVWFNS